MFAITFKEGQLEELLHIPEPWYIERVSFSLELKQLDVYVEFLNGALFTCSDCGATHQPVKDIADRDRTWRHLNFFEYPCNIHAELPRTDCGNCKRMMRVNVPWALNKPKHYFTLYFDAIAAQDLSYVTKISTVETSAKRGHNYITIFMDPEQKNVIFVTKGRDSGTWAECKKQFEAHGGKVENVTEVCMDMSPAFIKGAEENFPKAAITFDKFHVIQAANEAVDEVRRKERKSSILLKDTRYLWLKNPEKLSESQQETMAKMKDWDLDTAKAYRMRLIMQEIYR